ncbi:MAG: hypothetical protein SH821_17670 [Phototrophicales bacterium]|nr:hypothetical protein [Phototrophicales bacterium]
MDEIFMIFAHTLDKVLCGYKKQTRRLIKPDEKMTFQDGIYRVVSGKRIVYQVGKTYAVQPGRGKKSVARILLINIRREQVNLINHADAIAEGFDSPELFLATWKIIHGAKSQLSYDVWVLEFELYTSEFRGTYEGGKDRSFNNGDDISSPFKRIPRTGVYGRDYETGRMGTFISDRLSLSS